MKKIFDIFTFLCFYLAFAVVKIILKNKTLYNIKKEVKKVNLD